MKRNGKLALLTFLESQLSTAFFVFLLFGFYTPSIAVLSLIAVVIHESGHLFALSLLGKPARGLNRRLNGFVMDCSSLSYREERIVAFAGPFLNFLSALIAVPFLPLCRGYLSDFIALSLLTGISNLLPIEGYDGERILTSFLSERKETGTAFRFVRTFSFFLTVVFLFLSLFALMKTGEGYFIGGVFFVSFLSFIQNSPICKKTSI